MNEHTEAHEIADAMDTDLTKIRTMTEARAEITRKCGPPSEIGYQMHDNMADALFDRAHAARKARLRAEMAAIK